MKDKIKNTMKDVIIKYLDIMREENDKRNDIYKYGVDLINYENIYTKVALGMIVYTLGKINKKYPYNDKELEDYITWWLYEDVEKVITVGKKKYNVNSTKDFINFLLKH